MKKNRAFLILASFVFLVSLGFILLKLGYISFPNINLGFRNTYLAFSPDGVSFTSRKKVLTAFNVSCGIRLKDGTIALYGEDFVRNPDKIIVNPTTGFKITDLAVAVSEDGEQFERGELSIKNLTRNIQGADSAVVQLPDGRYRLYFVDNNNKEMFSALSNDGYDFTFEGKVDDIHMADPEIMYEQKAKNYYLFGRTDTQDGNLIVFTSKDGRHFSSQKEIVSPFNVQFSIISNGENYTAYGTPFYKTGVGGIPQSTSFDFRYPIMASSRNGLDWQWSEKVMTGPWKTKTTVVGSSAVIESGNGQSLFFYWTEK